MSVNLRDVLRRTLASSSQESDADLLERYSRTHDETAFATLVTRHGPMVLSTCRRMLGDLQAAEDAFQATFLVLARKAGALTHPDALAGWLHGVARNAALKARTLARPAVAGLPEAALPPDRNLDPLAELTGREVLAILEEEIHRLPASYRMAVVLCCLEGLSIEEVARRLNTTSGAVRGRLQRGRDRLSARLSARNLAPTAVLASAGMSHAVQAAVASPRARVVRAAARFAVGTSRAGEVPAAAQLIAEGVLNAMSMTRMKVVGAGFLALTLALAGGPILAGGLGLGRTTLSPPPVVAPHRPTRESVEQPPAERASDERADEKADRERGGKVGDRGRGADEDRQAQAINVPARPVRAGLIARYIVEPPDILRLEVTGLRKTAQPVKGEFLVRPDGTISLGAHGPILVAGQTIDQIRRSVAKLLIAQAEKPADFDVSADVSACNSKYYYVISDAGQAGEKVWRFPALEGATVVQAVLQVEGLAATARKGTVRVVEAGGTIRTVDWIAITQQGRSATNYAVGCGDRVYVSTKPSGK